MRRGSLSISTNAIVVLIVAVIMLGLIIGLVTQAFGSVERQFLNQIEQQPDPATPTVNTPITLSSEFNSGGPGDKVGFKVSIMNVEDGARWLRPKVECLDPAVGANVVETESDTSFIKYLQQRDFETYRYWFYLSNNAEQGPVLCRITAQMAYIDFPEDANANNNVDDQYDRGVPEDTDTSDIELVVEEVLTSSTTPGNTAQWTRAPNISPFEFELEVQG